MNERTIFLQALELASEPERSAFVARACGDDAGLRRRVEQLLRSNAEAGSFLGVPVLEQQEPPDATPGDRTETHAGPSQPNGDGAALDFLAPPRRAGSLGRLGHY